MKKFAKWLSTNPTLVVVMFFLAVLSGIAGLLTGWGQIYNDYLSKSIAIPGWLGLVILLLTPFILFSLRSSPRRAPVRELELVEGKEFGTQQIEIDGRMFIRCKFTGTELVYSGRGGVGFKECNFESPRFVFANEADQSLKFMQDFYEDPALRAVIEETFANIRAGRRLRSAPIANI